MYGRGDWALSEGGCCGESVFSGCDGSDDQEWRPGLLLLGA